MRTPCVALHDYRTDPALPQKDGVNLAHENIAALLRQAAGDGLSVRFHDLNRLLADESHARAELAGVDCVVANVGPHAHHYFALRERLGAGFRIVRDVRTAIWSSYLLQEHLCAPLLREGDLLLAASHYTRTLYRQLFAHLRGWTIHRCYPLTIGFPAEPPARPPRHPSPLVLGYLGRLSEDKNFPDLVELLIRLDQAEPGGYRLLACGDVHSDSCRPERIRAQLQQRLGRSDAFEHLAARPNHAVWSVLAGMDLLLFPSTSNLETLGRVLIEASFARVPVVCGEHAAAPELVPADALVPVAYHHGRRYDAHTDHSLGHVDIDGMARVIRQRRYRVSDCHADYHRHGDQLLAILRGQPVNDEPLPLHATPQAMIDALRVELPAPLSKGEALQQIAELARWFLVLQRKGSPERAAALVQLQRLSAHPQRTRRYIERSAQTRCDFSNVGGIDVELCNVLRFFPSFVLQAPPLSRAARRAAASSPNEAA